jgi:predicted dehydrogenase
MVGCFYKNRPPQAIHPYYRGAVDILTSDAIHAVDAIRYYCDLAEVAAVRSEVRTLDSWYATSFNAIVQFVTGAVGILLANWRTGKRTLKFEFHSLGASAFVDADGDGLVWTDNRTAPDFRASCTEFAGSADAYIAQGFLAENRAFIDGVKDNRSPHNSLSDAVKTMELVDRIYASAINADQPRMPG